MKTYNTAELLELFGEYSNHRKTSCILSFIHWIESREMVEKALEDIEKGFH